MKCTWTVSQTKRFFISKTVVCEFGAKREPQPLLLRTLLPLPLVVAAPAASAPAAATIPASASIYAVILIVRGRYMPLLALSRTLRVQATPQRLLFATAIFCFAHVATLQLRSAGVAGAQQTDQDYDLTPLELRHSGYTAADVVNLLNDLGAAGRISYAASLLLRGCALTWAYGAALSALLSIAAAVSPHELLGLTNLLPWAAAAVDTAEAVLLALAAAVPSLAVQLAPAAAATAAVKWPLLSATASTVGGIGLFCVLTAARAAALGKRLGPVPASQQQQQQQQQHGRPRGRSGVRKAR
jgi:hypothetical protein